jgi:hypothetical protein
MCKSPSPCLLCRLFGNVYTGRRLIVDDATAGSSPEAESRRVLFEALGDDGSGVVRDAPATGATETITRLQMDRRRLGAKSGALFTTEYARAQSVFEGRLTGSVPLTPLNNSEAEGEPAELVLLAATLRATDQIGGEASSGRGACQVRVRDDAGAEGPTLRVGGEAYALDALLRPEALNALRWGRVEGDL